MLRLAVGDGAFKPSIDATLPKKVGFRPPETGLNLLNCSASGIKTHDTYVVCVTMLLFGGIR